MEDIVANILSCQKKIQKYTACHDEDKLIYYLSKLKHLPIKVSHLEQTGVGRSVNSLRCCEGAVGERARSLVAVWMKMVTAEAEESGNKGSSSDAAHEAPVTTSSYSRKASSASPAASHRPSKEQPPPAQQSPEDDDDEDDSERLQIEEAENAEEGSPDSPSNTPIQVTSLLHTDSSDTYTPCYSSLDYSSKHSNNGSGTATNKYLSAVSKYSQPASCSDSDMSPKYNPVTSTQDYENLNSVTGEPPPYQPTLIDSPPADGDSPPANSVAASDAEEIELSSSRSSRHSEHKSKSKHRDKSKDKKHKSHSKEKESKDKDKQRHKSSDKEKERSHKDKRKDKERSPSKKHREPSENGKSNLEGLDRRRSKSHKHNDDSLIPDSSSRDISPVDIVVNGHDVPSVVPNTDGHEKVSSSSKHKSEDKRHSSSSSNRPDKKEEKHKDKKEKKPRDSSSQSSISGSDHKSKKRKMDDDAGFGAALMGIDPSSSPKKKKSKSHHRDKDQKDHKSKSTSSSSSKDTKKSSSSSSSSSSKSTSKSARTKDVSDEASSSKSMPRTVKADSVPPASPQLPPSLEEDALSKINPDYRPLPRVPLPDNLDEDVIDYRLYLPQADEAAPSDSKLTQEQTLDRMMTSKGKTKRQIYSGKSNCAASTEVPTLFNLTVRCLQDNIDALEVTGGIPFDLLKPVIEKATPIQLFNLENFNPYLLEDTHPLWEQHCKKQFKNDKPDEMETYRDMFMRLTDERQQRLKSLTENLKGKFVTKPAPRRTTQLAFVGTVAKPPKHVARAQARYGTGVAVGTPAKTTKAAEIIARKQAMQNIQRVERATGAGGGSSNGRPSASAKKPKAPLMAKTMQFYKKTFRR